MKVLDPKTEHPPEPVLSAASSRRLYTGYAAVAALILAFGAIRLPLETELTREHHAAYFGNVQLNLSLRAKIGQLGFLAALSGFRTLVADLIWIQAHTAWERVEYGPMNLMFNTVTTLAPRNVNFWDMSAWHMAYNASVAVMENPKVPSFVKRKQAQHEYFMLGIDYLERGIANNPNVYVLHQSLGNIYKYKLSDHWHAFQEFDKAAACPHPPTYEKRFAAYELSQVPGHEREAWQRLRKLYDMGEQERLPTLETDLKKMEQALELPEDQRIYKVPVVNPLKSVEEKLQIPPEQRVYKAP